jgi:hypothetical protein
VQSFPLEQRQLVELKVGPSQMVITGIIVLQINHISICVLEEFAEKKVNKLLVRHFRKHWSSDRVVQE